ncbi:M48 family metallopeptidase [Clostridium sp. YIM B02505]|uniref:M48 family metallopeptidase n=1 Tax=Clostridium yunnanense TaxID=2800325 RepID=A0ABS1EQM7_9CLOT|nr:SprT family zinc-dependent metalloprotease [Clostridium yunnanense]MBK1811702.1 M48 family metallopeptidase [Clostridium yunnanense]
MEYQLIRSKRKTVAIEVKEDKIIIKCPYNCSKQYLDSLIDKNRAWIEETHKKVMSKKDKKLVCKEGQSVYFMGIPYKIKVIRGATDLLEFNGDEFIFTTMSSLFDNNEESEKTRMELMMAWFRKQGTEYLTKRTCDLAKQLGLTINKVYIKNVRTIWGSCSTNNNINYNIRLISMPKEIIDYVIIHELCHLVQRNHSEKFWQLVERIIPDYKQKRSFLKNNSSKYCNW